MNASIFPAASFTPTPAATDASATRLDAAVEPPPAKQAPSGALGSRPDAKGASSVGIRIARTPSANPALGPGAYRGEQTQLFVQGDHDATAIHWNDIQQGSADTCTILAAAGGLAYTSRGRMALSRIIRDQGDGNIAVTLWKKEMSIPLGKVKGMPAHLGDYNARAGDPRSEIWPKAIEAGYARGAKWLFNVEFHRKPDSPEGAPIKLALEAVTGQPATIKNVASMSGEQTLATIGKELNRNKLILAATRVDDAVKAYGLVPRHAYAVLGVNAQKNSVFLFDPHGKTLSVPMDVFQRCFGGIGWAYVP